MNLFDHLCYLIELVTLNYSIPSNRYPTQLDFHTQSQNAFIQTSASTTKKLRPGTVRWIVSSIFPVRQMDRLHNRIHGCSEHSGQKYSGRPCHFRCPTLRQTSPRKPPPRDIRGLQKSPRPMEKSTFPVECRHSRLPRYSRTHDPTGYPGRRRKDRHQARRTNLRISEIGLRQIREKGPGKKIFKQQKIAG